MVRLLNQLIPGMLCLAGILVMATSSLIGGGSSAMIGLPLFLSGFLWLLYPSLRHRRRNS